MSGLCPLPDMPLHPDHDRNAATSDISVLPSEFIQGQRRSCTLMNQFQLPAALARRKAIL